MALAVAVAAAPPPLADYMKSLQEKHKAMAIQTRPMMMLSLFQC